MVSAAQLRAARALLNWHQSQVAEAAQISVGTIRNFEAGRGTPNAATLTVVRLALEAAGVEFLDHDGVRLRPRS